MRGLVLFDFGGTLDADGARWSIRFHSAYRAVGGQQSFAAFEKAFRESDRALERLSGIEQLGFRAMVDAQAGLLLARLPDGVALSKRDIADHFHSSTCAVVRRNEALLARLHESYHLGVVSTDPPYYDNIGYADLSDFFYVWLRRSLKSKFPQLLATLSVPKSAELVATPYRHGGKEEWITDRRLAPASPAEDISIARTSV